MRLRASVLVWGSAVLLLAAVPVAATPAQANSLADLAVRISGPAAWDGLGEHVFTATVVNRGPGRASGITLRFSGRVDSEAVDPESFRFCVPAPTPPTVVHSLTVEISGSCPLPDLAPGHSHGLPSMVVGGAAALGPVGEMTLVVEHSGTDPAPGDNSATARLGVDGRTGYRLYARSTADPTDPGRPAEVVPPGGTGTLHFEIGNAGPAPVNGFTVTIRLPRRVTFAQTHPGCTYAPDRRSATCTYRDLPLVPASTDTSSGDRSYSALRFRHRFQVDRSAPTRTRLDDGELRVEPLVTGYLPMPVTRLPEGVTGLQARDFAAQGDQDRLVVVTGDSPDDGAGAGDRGSRAGLPVTGTPGGTLGLTGLGLAAAGAVLLLLSRWRTRQ